MADILQDYSSRNVEVAFFGESVTGLAESFLSSSRNSDFTSSKIGADGSVGTSVSPDETGTLELTLDQNAPLNIFLSGVIEVQKGAGRLFRGAFTFKDPSGGAVVKYARVHIQAGPTIVGASERQDRTWTLFVEDYVYLSVPAGMADEIGVLADISAGLDSLPSSF
jgi:hypothetical protein